LSQRRIGAERSSFPHESEGGVSSVYERTVNAQGVENMKTLLAIALAATALTIGAASTTTATVSNAPMVVKGLPFTATPQRQGPRLLG
jgi:hypothetical protein